MEPGQRDYYELLGVSPKAAAREIKRAWLKLARKEHPDVNPGDRSAAERFALLQEAWNVLSNRAAREEYDRRGRRPASVAPAVPASGARGAAGGWEQVIRELFPESAAPVADALAPARGEDVHRVLEVSFEESLRGAVRECTYRRETVCAACRGRRWAPGAPLATCPACGGRGVTEVAHGPWTVRRICPTCNGQGEAGAEACPACRGRGHVPSDEKRALRVPAGANSGTRLVVAGGGQPGRRGGEAGDLVVTLKVLPHPLLERRGQNLHATVPVTLPQAVLGGPVPVPTAQGRAMLRLPPGTQCGQVFVLRGRGVPAPGGRARGDLHVTISVTLPSADDPRVRRAMLELEKALAAPAKGAP